MMKMDGRNSTECQNWEMKGRSGHFWKRFKSLKDEIVNSAFFIKSKEGKTWDADLVGQ